MMTESSGGRVSYKRGFQIALWQRIVRFLPLRNNSSQWDLCIENFAKEEIPFRLPISINCRKQPSHFFTKVPIEIVYRTRTKGSAPIFSFQFSNFKKPKNKWNSAAHFSRMDHRVLYEKSTFGLWRVHFTIWLVVEWRALHRLESVASEEIA